MKTTPMPNEVHPAYTHMSEQIISWLENTTDNHLVLSVANTSLAKPIDYDEISTVNVKQKVLRRVVCGGFAPYVGKPFVYKWYACIDEFNRVICTDSKIEYL